MSVLLSLSSEVFLYQFRMGDVYPYIESIFGKRFFYGNILLVAAIEFTCLLFL